MVARAVAPRRSSPFGLFAMIALVAIIAVLFLIQNQAHADSKHAAAPIVRKTYKDGLCTSVGMYYSPTRGTALVLCSLPDSEQWGGMVFRVTEMRDGNIVWLGSDAYESTCFVSDSSYWNRVLKRDGYVLLATKPDLKHMFEMWLSAEL